jgi:polyhydroxybutyrate depolymerase
MADMADTTAVPPASDEGMPADLDLATSGEAGAGGASGGGGVAMVGAAGMGGGGGATTTLCTPARPHDPGPTTVTLQSGGTNRSYILHVPPGYDGTTQVPLVFDIHGFTSWAEEQLQRSKWDEMADKEGFVVIAPDGVNQSWNAGNCCDGNAENDVQLFRDMVEKATVELCIDSKRVYVSGHSNGGAMAYRLACEAADLFAAVNPVCGAMGMSIDPCNPSRPIPVLATRATEDGAVTIDSADGDIDEWLTNNECDESAMTTSGVCKTYTSCSAGTQVTDCRPGGGHGFYYASGSGNPDNYLVPDNVWPFFQQFSLP